jgi:hypothetical protein
MAADDFLQTAKKSLHEDGYLILDDSEVGRYVEEIAQKGFQHLSLSSPYGFDYCKQHVFDHPVSVMTYSLGLFSDYC